MCIPPKTGTTSWQVFFIKNQYGNKTSFKKRIDNLDNSLRPLWLNNVTPRFHEFTNNSQFLNSRNLIKIINSRHPFERIYSAWHEKFTVHDSEWSSKINSKSQLNRALKIHFGNILGLFPKQYEIIKNRYEWKSDRKGSDLKILVTFPAFLRFILDDLSRLKNGLKLKYKNGVDNKNQHWDPMYLECDPCNINYNIITKTETLKSDVQKVIELLDYKDGTFPNANNSTKSLSTVTGVEKIARNYAAWKIPLSTIMKLEEKYRLDFELFDYNFQEFYDAYLKLINPPINLSNQ